MSIDRHRRHTSIGTMATMVTMASIAAVVCACSGPANESRQTVAERAANESGLVSPLKSDTSDQIVSWVDGQVVTDWAAETSEAPAGHRRISGRHRSRPRRKIRLSQRTEPATRLALVQEQPGWL